MGMVSCPCLLGPEGTGTEAWLKVTLGENVPIMGKVKRSPKQGIDRSPQHRMKQLVQDGPGHEYSWRGDEERATQAKFMVHERSGFMTGHRLTTLGVGVTSAVAAVVVLDYDRSVDRL